MPRGDKSKYTDKQKRKAEHIAEGYEDRGVSKKMAKARAWATVNKVSKGGEKPGGGGYGKSEDRSSSVMPVDMCTPSNSSSEPSRPPRTLRPSPAAPIP